MNLKDIYGMFFGSFDRDNVDPVILSERGFALVNGKEIVFDKEYHYQNLQDVVRGVYPQEFLDICKKCDNDSMEYIKYLMKKDVIIFLNYSLAHLDEYKVDGVIDVTLTACHTYAIETEKVRRTVEGCGKSYLAIETNYSNSDAPQIRTRLEAFVEML